MVLVTYFNKLPNLFWCRCVHDHKFKHSKRCLLQDYISKLEQFVTLHFWPYYFKHFARYTLYILYSLVSFIFQFSFVCLRISMFFLLFHLLFSLFLCTLHWGTICRAIVTLIWPHHIIIIFFFHFYCQILFCCSLLLFLLLRSGENKRKSK